MYREIRVGEQRGGKPYRRVRGKMKEIEEYSYVHLMYMHPELKGQCGITLCTGTESRRGQGGRRVAWKSHRKRLGGESISHCLLRNTTAVNK